VCQGLRQRSEGIAKRKSRADKGGGEGEEKVRGSEGRERHSTIYEEEA